MAQAFNPDDFEVDTGTDTPASKPAASAPTDDVGSEVEIEIVDDTPEKDRGRKPLEREVADPTEAELESYSAGVKQRIKELTHAKHDERRRAEALAREKAELERVTQQLLEDRKRMQQYIQTGQTQYAETLKEAAGSELDVAKRAYREAYESGDADKIVEAQEKLTRASLRVADANKFKPEPVVSDEFVVQTQQSAPQQNALDEKTLRWQARNQWFGAPGFEEITSYSLGLHQKLVNSGVDPRSDEYFDTIDKRVRTTFPEIFSKEKAEQEQTPERTKKPASVVAPATRASGAKTIRLTATQVALAKRLGLTPQQYAAELAKTGD